MLLGKFLTRIELFNEERMIFRKTLAFIRRREEKRSRQDG